MAASESITLDQTNDDSSAPNLSNLDPNTLETANSALLDQVDRILRSDELHSSEVLRRLLKFLAQKTVSGEADDLKEYIVAIEGLGRPTTYDPRQNSAVRIQVGRLRQKLENYYRREGQHDQILIDIPKGRFKLKGESRECSINSVPQDNSAPVALAEPAEKLNMQRFKHLAAAVRAAAWVAAGIMLALAGEALLHRARPANANSSAISTPVRWDASIEELWRPFLTSTRPMLVAIDDPLYVEIDPKKAILYHDRTLDTWEKVVSSPEVKAISELLKSHDIEPVRYFTAYQEANASFMLARLLGWRVQSMSVVKATDLSMRDVAENNIVFVGNQNEFFSQQMKASPIESPLQLVPEGVRNLHPGPNEQELYFDNYALAPSDEGFAYALVSHLPGPLGGNDVVSFTSIRAAGYAAAVQSFTDPGFVRPLVAKLKQAGGGQMPRYYQVLLKIQFKSEVPKEITYVLCRELQYAPKQ